MAQSGESDPFRLCDCCQVPGQGMKRCARCKSVYYCSKGCQALHWTCHKAQCAILVEQQTQYTPPSEALLLQHRLLAQHPGYSYFVIPEEAENNIGIIFEDHMVSLMFYAFRKRARRGGAHSLALLYKQLLAHGRGQIDAAGLRRQLEREYQLTMDEQADEPTITQAEMEEAAEAVKRSTEARRKAAQAQA